MGATAILANLAELGPWQKSEECLGQKEHTIPVEKTQERQAVEEGESAVEDENESDDEWTFD